MNVPHTNHLIAADVGNSAVKLRRFVVPSEPDHSPTAIGLPPDGVDPTVVWAGDIGVVDAADQTSPRLEMLLLQLPAVSHRWYVVSVNRSIEERFSAWIAHHRPQDEYLVLNHRNFPLEIDVPAPERVGTDRLAAATAANHARAPHRSAIVIDAGTAVTVDYVSQEGVFCGGAILPGIRTAATSLATATDALPLVEDLDLSAAPGPIGKTTQEAIRSGIVWGVVGGVLELIHQMSREAAAPPEFFCTGGDGMQLARLIQRASSFDPNLVLRGAALTGLRHLSRTANS
jgi:type III pantothenate kinase